MCSKGNYSMKSIFSDVQFSETNHPSCKKVLTDIYKKSNTKEFIKEFTTCLKICLVHGEKSANVERTLDFAADFAVSFSSSLKDEETCPLLEGVFQYIFENHDCPVQLVRLRVCQLMNRLLDYMGQDATVIEDTYNKIAECMLIRLKDSMTSVRTQAVYALHRLQTPNDPKCDIIKTFTFHMTHDPCYEVRRAVVQKIAVNKLTLAHILTRMNDVKDSVRKEAYTIIGKFLIRQFTIKQRQLILDNGLNDRSELVRDYVLSTLVPKWLKYFNHNYYDFLECIHVEKIPDNGIKLLKAIFEKQHDVILESRVKELGLVNQLLPYDKLNVISVVFWRALAEHCRPSDDSDKFDHIFEQILPDLTPFCNYIREFFFPQKTRHVSQENNTLSPEENSPHNHEQDEESSQDENMENNTATTSNDNTSGDGPDGSRTKPDENKVQEPDEAVLVHLLETCKVFDLADELGRSNLRQLCVDLLQSSAVTLVSIPVLTSLLDHTVPSTSTKLSVMAEIITELREPLLAAEASVYVPDLLLQEAEEKKAEIGDKIAELETEYEIAEELDDITRVEEIKALKQNLQEELKIMNAVTPQEPGRATNDDPETLKKCLTIVVEIMKKGKILKMDSTLYSLMQNFIIPTLSLKTSGEGAALIRNLALQALGIFCVLDGELAKEHFLTFCYNIANDTLSVTSLKCVFDMLHVYGLACFNIEDPDSLNNSEQQSEDEVSKKPNMVVLLMSLLSSESPEMRRTAVIGLCKLLFSGRLQSPDLVSKLIILWYNPAVDNDPHIRQPLGVFFPAFSRGCPNAPQLLVRAFLPTVKTFFKLDIIDPLMEVDVEKVANLIVELTRPNFHGQDLKDYSSHNQLAIKICEEVLSEELDSLNCTILVKTLNQLDLNFSISTDISILMALSARMVKSTPKEDKTLMRLVVKFDTMLQVKYESNQSVSTVHNTLPDTSATSVRSAASELLVSQNSSESEGEEEEEEEELSQDETLGRTTLSLSQDEIVIPGTPDTSDDESDSVFKGFPEEKRTVSPDSEEDFKGFLPLKKAKISSDSKFKRPSSPTSTRTPFKVPAKTPKRAAKTPGKKAPTPASDTSSIKSDTSTQAKTPKRAAKTPGKKASTSASDTSSIKSDTSTQAKTPRKTPAKTSVTATRVSARTPVNKNHLMSPGRKTPASKQCESPEEKISRNNISESPGRKTRQNKDVEPGKIISDDSKIKSVPMHASKKSLQSPEIMTLVNNEEISEKRVSKSRQQSESPDKRTSTKRQSSESPEKRTPKNRQSSESPEKRTSRNRQPSESPDKSTSRNRQSAESPEKRTSRNRQPSESPEKRTSRNRQPSESPEKSTSRNRQSAESPEKRTSRNIQPSESPEKRTSRNRHASESPEKRTSRNRQSAESPEKRTSRNRQSSESPDKRTSRNRKASESPEKRTQKIPQDKMSSESREIKVETENINKHSPGKKSSSHKTAELQTRTSDGNRTRNSTTSLQIPQKDALANKVGDTSPEKRVIRNSKSFESAEKKVQEDIDESQKSPGRKSRLNRSEKRTSGDKNPMESPEKKTKCENYEGSQQKTVDEIPTVGPIKSKRSSPIKSPKSSLGKNMNRESPRRNAQTNQNVAVNSDGFRSKQSLRQSKNQTSLESPGQKIRSSQSSLESLQNSSSGERTFSSPTIDSAEETFHESTKTKIRGIRKLGQNSEKKKLSTQSKSNSSENSETESPNKRATRSKKQVGNPQNAPGKRHPQSPENRKSKRKQKVSSQSSNSTDLEDNSSPDIFKPITRSTRKLKK